MAEQEVTEETPFKAPIGKIWAWAVGIVLATSTCWGTYSAAQIAAEAKVDLKLQAVESRREERLKNYPTWADVREMRQEDFKYWDSRLDELKLLIIRLDREEKGGK